MFSSLALSVLCCCCCCCYAIVAVAVASVFCSAGLRDYESWVCCFWDKKNLLWIYSPCWRTVTADACTPPRGCNICTKTLLLPGYCFPRSLKMKVQAHLSPTPPHPRFELKVTGTSNSLISLLKHSVHSIKICASPVRGLYWACADRLVWCCLWCSIEGL